VKPYLPGLFHDTYWLPLALTVVVIGYCWWHNRRAGRTSRDVLAADIHAAERIEDRID
jgi:hypothetical protein